MTFQLFFFCSFSTLTSVWLPPHCKNLFWIEAFKCFVSSTTAGAKRYWDFLFWWRFLTCHMEQSSKWNFLAQFRWNSSSSLSCVHLKNAEHSSEDTNSHNFLPRSSKNLEGFPLKIPKENLSLDTKLCYGVSVTVNFRGKKKSLKLQVGHSKWVRGRTDDMLVELNGYYMQKQIQ